MSEPAELLHATFPAMGSEIEILLFGIPSDEYSRAIRSAQCLAGEWEATFSRFDAASELSRLNAVNGEPVAVSKRMYEAVERAIEAARATGGLFNPLILPELVKLGYDRSLEELPHHRRMSAATAPAPAVGLIQVDPESRTVTLPRGAGLDLGGLAKGFYVDALVGRLAGYPAGMVSAGGDLRVWGHVPGQERWTIGVEHPAYPAIDALEIEISAGSVATSGTNRRSWALGDETAHHLIDPRTGRPAVAPLGSITVVADTATTADVLATALFVGGASPEQTASHRSLFSLAILAGDDGVIQTIEGELQHDVYIHEPGSSTTG